MDIRLTEAGREASGQNEQQLDTEALFGCLNEAEQANLSNYLNRIISALEQQFGNSESETYFHGRPPFGGRRFGRRFDVGDDRPPFDRRDFAWWPDAGD